MTTQSRFDQIAAEASESWRPSAPQAEKDALTSHILAAIEKALKAQADETKACIKMVGGLGAAHASELPKEDYDNLVRDAMCWRHQQAHASEHGSEWIPLADGRGQCGVKDKEGWIARGLTEHQAMTISAAHNAALADAFKRGKLEGVFASPDEGDVGYVRGLEQQLAAEREKLKPLVEALEWYAQGTLMTKVAKDALAKLKEDDVEISVVEGPVP